MWILGISKSHNGAVALSNNGKVISAIQAERISRVKRQAIKLENDKTLVSECVNYCLDQAGIKHSDLHSISICTPWDVVPIENEKLFNLIGGIPKNYKKTYYVPHHYAHAEYILHYSNLSKGIILVIDGSGTKEKDRKLFNIQEKVDTKCKSYVEESGKETISAYFFDGKEVTLIYRLGLSADKNNQININGNGFLQSIGHYWRWASNYCCGSHSEAGKVMGLAAFGNCETHKDLKILTLDLDGFLEVNYKKLNEKFKHPNIFGKDLTQNSHYSDIAAMVQKDTENILIKILTILKNKYPTDTLYYSGGVALNMVANEKIIRSNLFKNIILNGSVEDNGTAIGAALAAYNAQTGARSTSPLTDYYGKVYSDDEILKSIKKFPFKYELLTEEKKYRVVSSLIFENNVVGWFQDRSEFGPRALGNRSILANPKSQYTKYILDLHIKQRDRYRPYSPVVLEEYAKKFFDIEGNSPVMMSGGKVLSNNFPAITHRDNSARVQTLSEKNNKIFYRLIKSFYKISGYPIILNTSFNLPGEPIVENPTDALNSFTNGALQYLCIGNYLVTRNQLKNKN
jgi:carbamoyltransferase